MAGIIYETILIFFFTKNWSFIQSIFEIQFIQIYKNQKLPALYDSIGKVFELTEQEDLNDPDDLLYLKNVASKMFSRNY